MIIAGFVGVGKSKAAEEWDNCVNIELSPLCQFQPDCPPGRRSEEAKGLRQYIRNPLYPYNAILKILEEEASGKLVIINAVKSILVPLSEEYQRRCVLVYPDTSLRGKYENMYRRRGNNSTFVCRMMNKWSDRLQFLREFDNGSIHLPLKAGTCHLSDLRPVLEKLRERAQPPVNSDILCRLKQKLDVDRKSYFLINAQNCFALPVDLCSDALREYLCHVVVENMPRPSLTQNLPDSVIQVKTLEEFLRMSDI